MWQFLFCLFLPSFWRNRNCFNATSQNIGAATAASQIIENLEHWKHACMPANTTKTTANATAQISLRIRSAAQHKSKLNRFQLKSVELLQRRFLSSCIHDWSIARRLWGSIFDSCFSCRLFRNTPTRMPHSKRRPFVGPMPFPPRNYVEMLHLADNLHTDDTFQAFGMQHTELRRHGLDRFGPRSEFQIRLFPSCTVLRHNCGHS